MKKNLSRAWIFMFLVCLCLGAVPNPTGAVKVALVLLAVLFFLPGGLLLYNAITEKDQKMVKRIRALCIISLALTTLLFSLTIVLGILSIAGVVSSGFYQVVSFLFMAVSVPLHCGQYYFLSLFLWAFLLFSTFIKHPDQRKKQDQR